MLSRFNESFAFIGGSVPILTFILVFLLRVWPWCVVPKYVSCVRYSSLTLTTVDISKETLNTRHVRQGCSLSPILFNLIPTDHLTRCWKNKVISGIKINSHKFLIFFYTLMIKLFRKTKVNNLRLFSIYSV